MYPRGSFGHRFRPFYGVRSLLLDHSVLKLTGIRDGTIALIDLRCHFWIFLTKKNILFLPDFNVELLLCYWYTKRTTIEDQSEVRNSQKAKRRLEFLCRNGFSEVKNLDVIFDARVEICTNPIPSKNKVQWSRRSRSWKMQFFWKSKSHARLRNLRKSRRIR